MRPSGPAGNAARTISIGNPETREVGGRAFSNGQSRAKKLTNGRFWPTAEAIESTDEFRFLGCSGRKILTLNRGRDGHC
jgi:hypothetical protein